METDWHREQTTASNLRCGGRRERRRIDNLSGACDKRGVCFGRCVWPRWFWWLVPVSRRQRSAVVRVGFDQSFKVGQWTRSSSRMRLLTHGLAKRSSPIRMASAFHIRSHGKLLKARMAPRVWVGVIRSGRLDGGLEVRVLDDRSVPLQHRKLSASRNQQLSTEDSSPLNAAVSVFR